MRKGKLALALALVAMSTAVVAPTAEFSANADVEIAPFYAYTSSITNSISKSGTTVYCDSAVIGLSSSTKIEMYQFLEKQNGSSWKIVQSWSKTSTTTRASISTSTSSLASGTYRVRTTAYVHSGTSLEYVTKIGSSVTV